MRAPGNQPQAGGARPTEVGEKQNCGFPKDLAFLRKIKLINECIK